MAASDRGACIGDEEDARTENHVRYREGRNQHFGKAMLAQNGAPASFVVAAQHLIGGAIGLG